MENGLAVQDGPRLVSHPQLVEAWGDYVDPLEPLRDDPGLGIAIGPVSLVQDRKGGCNRPFFETETQLASIRGVARVLHGSTPHSIGALRNLTNYTIGTGLTYSVIPAPRFGERSSNDLLDEVQHVIDGFCHDNDWIGDREREFHLRAHRDGEVFLALRPGRDGKTAARFIEPEQVKEPANPRELEEWLGLGEAEPLSWSFGVATPEQDAERALGYHVCFDDDGSHYDFFPSGDVALAFSIGSGLIEHTRLNVDRNVKRGISDFYAVRTDLEREAKLRRNTAEGAALQAAIAWVYKMPPGTSETTAQSALSAASDGSFNRTAFGGVRTERYQHFGPGTVIRTPEGASYDPGPMGSQRNPNLLLVADYMLRAVGVRWNMPEYMVSGDASNANYASTMVAESPFVKARQADQAFYRSRFVRVMWRVLEIAHAAGRFAHHNVTFAQLQHAVEVVVKAPEVASHDPLQAEQIQQMRYQNGIISKETWRAKAGLDHDDEEAKIAREAGQKAEQTPSASPA